MVRPLSRVALQILALTLLIIVVNVVHVGAKLIVAEGFGPVAIVIAFSSLPFLARHLD